MHRRAAWENGTALGFGRGLEVTAEEAGSFVAAWLGLPIAVRVRESARAKNVLLRVSLERGLEIVCPAGYDYGFLPAAVAGRREWIERTVARLWDVGGLVHPGGEEAPERVVLTAFSREFAVRYVAGARGGCRVADRGPGEIVVSGAVQDGALVRRALRGFVRERTGPWLVAALREVSRAVGLPFVSARVRAQRGRWGSCTARGTVSLNASLAFLPFALCRYVFVHELCHTLHLDHSPRYWAAVAAVEPDCRRLDAALSRAGAYVPLWWSRGIRDGARECR